MPVTIGYSPCPNDTFIFHALIHGLIEGPKVQWNPLTEDVESLNEKALRGELPITKLSFFAYAFCHQHYQLLDAGAALGFGCGPLLITTPSNRHKPVEEMTIGIPGQYTTAHFLFSLAYPSAKQKYFMVFSEIEAAVQNGVVDAGVIIHENRFTYQERGFVAIQDLGAYWETQSGKAIPLGGIAIRRDLDEAFKWEVQEALAASVLYAKNNPAASAAYVASLAQEMDPEVRRQHIDLYVNDYSIRLGVTGRTAIQDLYHIAFSNGVIPELPQHIFLQKPE